MNDKTLNALLKKQGIQPMEARVVDPGGNIVKGLKLDANIFKAKKQINGVPWHSNLNLSNNRIEAFLKDELDKLQLVSEYYEHFLPDIETFIQYGKEKGMLTNKDEVVFLNETTSRLVKLRETGREVPLTPGLLLLDFTQAVSNISTEISTELEDIKRQIHSFNPKIDLSKFTDRWVIDKARRLRILSKPQDNRVAQLFDKKERIMAYYKSKADLFKAGNSELADAFAFAILWREVMNSQSKRAKRQDDEAFANKISEFQQKTGINPIHDENLMKRLKEATPKYQYTKLSSVLNLFPTGALQFLDMLENKRITQYVKVPKNISGFFIHQEMSEDKLNEIKKLEGEYIILKDSMVVGSGFQLAVEDFNQEKISNSTPRKKMMKENYSHEQIEAVCSKEYSRGGKSFVGGYQVAKVVYVETRTNNGKLFQSGVRLWLQEVKLLTESQIKELEIAQN